MNPKVTVNQQPPESKACAVCSAGPKHGPMPAVTPHAAWCPNYGVKVTVNQQPRREIRVARHQVDVADRNLYAADSAELGLRRGEIPGAILLESEHMALRFELVRPEAIEGHPLSYLYTTRLGGWSLVLFDD